MKKKNRARKRKPESSTYAAGDTKKVRISFLKTASLLRTGSSTCGFPRRIAARAFYKNLFQRTSSREVGERGLERNTAILNNHYLAAKRGNFGEDMCA